MAFPNNKTHENLLRLLAYSVHCGINVGSMRRKVLQARFISDRMGQNPGRLEGR